MIIFRPWAELMKLLLSAKDADPFPPSSYTGQNIMLIRTGKPAKWRHTLSVSEVRRSSMFSVRIYVSVPDTEV